MTTRYEKPAISDDLLTPSDEGARRLKVSSASRVESTVTAGKTFTGLSTRTAVAPPTTFDVIIVTGDKWVRIESTEVTIDFANSGTGEFKHVLVAAVDTSSGNTWTYTPVTPAPAGRPINAALINKLPEATVQFDVGADFTGTFDYQFFYADYYRETNGSNSSLTSNDIDFFTIGKVLLPPNSELLVRATSTGSLTGTVDIVTNFFITELTDEEVVA